MGSTHPCAKSTEAPSPDIAAVSGGSPPGDRRRHRPPTEVSQRWQARIGAPAGFVWNELGLDAILAAAPGLTADVDLEGRAATVLLHLRVGPFRRVVAGHAALHRLRPPRHLLLLVDVPALALDYRATLDLTPLGLDVTNLRGEGHLLCAHQWIRRQRPLLAAVVEDHLRALADTATRRAEARWQAQVRLGGGHPARRTRRRSRHDAGVRSPAAALHSQWGA